MRGNCSIILIVTLISTIRRNLISTYLVDFIATRVRQRRRIVGCEAAGDRGKLEVAVVLVRHELAQLRRRGERRPIAERGNPPLQESPPRLHSEVARAAVRLHQPGRGSLELVVSDQGSQLGIGLEARLEIDELLKLNVPISLSDHSSWHRVCTIEILVIGDSWSWIPKPHLISNGCHNLSHLEPSLDDPRLHDVPERLPSCCVG